MAKMQFPLSSLSRSAAKRAASHFELREKGSSTVTFASQPSMRNELRKRVGCSRDLGIRSDHGSNS